MIVVDTRPKSIPMSEGSSFPDAGYDAGHIKGPYSYWVDSWPVNKKEQEDRLRAKADELKALDKPIAIICRSGAGGAKHAISVLKDEGIDVSRLFIQDGGGEDLIGNHLDKLESAKAVGAQSIPAADEKEEVIPQGDVADDAAATPEAAADTPDTGDAADTEAANDPADSDETPVEDTAGEQTPDAEPSAE